MTLPEGWKPTTLGSVLKRVTIPVNVEPEREYREIGIRSHGKGIFHKSPVRGESLGEKRVFWVVPNALVLNIVFAWEQAVAITSDQEAGMIASHRFPMYKPIDATCDVRFLLHFFRTPRGKDLLEITSPGGAGRNKTLGQKQFENLKIAMPPMAEQVRIAALLDILDRAIVVAGMLVHKTITQKRFIADELLNGYKRLPSHKSPWLKQSLSTIANIVMGSSPSSSTYNNLGIGLPLIQGNADVKEHLSAPKLFTSEVTRECFPGDILLSVRAPVGTVARSIHHACLGRGMAAIKPLTGISHDYLYQLLLATESLWRRLSQGSTFDAVTTHEVARLKVTLPKAEHEQKDIALILETADQELRCLQMRQKLLRQEKHALAQRLFSVKQGTPFSLSH